MPKFLIYIVFVLFVLPSYAQKKEIEKEHYILPPDGLQIMDILPLTEPPYPRKTKKGKKRGVYEIIRPPNCIQIKDSLFIDRTEVANLHWLEYLAKVRDTSFVYYQSQKQDTSIVYEDCRFGNKNFNYHNYPGTRFDPVVGMSYEQVVNFCKWRSLSATDYINNEMLMVEKKISKEKRKILENYIVEFEYRLPSKEEWELAAGEIDTVIKSKGRKKRRETHSLEYWKEQFSVDTCFNTHWIFMFKPNERGLYNMFGNVAEMVQEKGIAKGGHYRMDFKDISVEKDYPYDRPKNWLGFRCVAIVRIRPKNKTNP